MCASSSLIWKAAESGVQELTLQGLVVFGRRRPKECLSNKKKQNLVDKAANLVKNRDTVAETEATSLFLTK